MKAPEKKKELFTDEKIILLLDQKEDLSDDISQIVMGEPELLDTIFNEVSSKTARVKFRCAKILNLISAIQPELLISHWNFFINLLDSDNKIILWNALDVIANLTKQDPERKFDQIYQHYFKFLEDDSMVTAAHVIENSTVIISNRPDLQDEITKKLLKIRDIPRTEDCHDILSGKALQTMDSYYDNIDDEKAVIEFALKTKESKRNATRVKAEKFLKKHGK